MLEGLTLLLLFPSTESEQRGVLLGSLLAGLELGHLDGTDVTAALKGDRGDEALDLGSLDTGLLAFLLGRDDTLDDVLADIVFFAQVEELADLAGTLGTEAAGHGGVSETGQLGFSLLDNDQAQDGQVVSDDTATDALALTFTAAAGAVAGVTLGQEQADTLVQQDSLLHGETLLVVTAGDLEDVAFEFLAQGVGFDFLGDALVHEDAQLAFIGDFNELLATSGRVSDVKLSEWKWNSRSELESERKRKSWSEFGNNFWKCPEKKLYKY